MITSSPPLNEAYLTRMLNASGPNPLVAGNDTLVDRSLLRSLIIMAQRAIVYEKELRKDVAILSGYAQNHRDKIPLLEVDKALPETERGPLIAKTMSKAATNEDRCDAIRACFGWPSTP